MAKSYNNLWQKMIDPANVEVAIYSAAKGKRHNRQVLDALADIPATVARIKGMLERDEWRPPEVREGRIFKDPRSGKTRPLVKPDFDEQIVHHLLIDFVIAPIFKPTFYEWSCGSIPGRGQEMMSRYILRKIKRGGRRVKYCAVLDIAKCFPSIDTEAVYRAIAAKVRDRRVLNIVQLILAANLVRFADGTEMRGGLPIGLFTSPWFVNIALTVADRAVKTSTLKRNGIYLYVRYIDDMLLVHGNKRELRRAIEELGRVLATMELRLKHTPGIELFKVVRFTGFHATRERTRVRDRVFLRARRTGTRIRRKIERRIRVTAYDAERLISYGGRFRSFGSYNAFPSQVLCGIKFYVMRQKVSRRDQLRAYSRKEAVNAICV